MDPFPIASVQRLTAEAMATTFTITVAHAEAVYARQAASAALAELPRLERRLSRFLPESDVARINRLGRARSAVVQPETFECLQVALDVYRATAGAFDVAYGSDRWEPRPRFRLDRDTHAVEVLGDGVRLDLGGIGKGYALDFMARVLVDWEVTAALLAASTSTLLALDPPPGGEGWPVSIGPVHARRQFGLVQRALSGSGRGAQGEHVIDPRSRHPAADRQAAWVVAPTAARADALSTALMVMSEEVIPAVCRREKTPAWLQRSAAAGLIAVGDPSPLWAGRPDGERTRVRRHTGRASGTQSQE